MVDTLRGSFSPPNIAVSIIAHAARTAKPPELLARTILTGHLLRALSRQETINGRIERNSPFSVKEIGISINHFRKLPVGISARQEWHGVADEFLQRAYRVFADATRLAEIENTKNDVADIGLRFMLQLAVMDTKNKENFIYPLSATDAFLTLGLAREILRDLNAETRNLACCNMTDNIEFEPISGIERFYEESRRKIPHDLRMWTAAPEDVNDAALHLADIADKLQKFTSCVYQRNTGMPHLRFKDREGSSLIVLRDYLMPYKEGRDAVIKAGRNKPAHDGKILDFTPPLKRGDGIIRNTPAPTNA